MMEEKAFPCFYNDKDIMPRCHMDSYSQLKAKSAPWFRTKENTQKIAVLLFNSPQARE